MKTKIWGSCSAGSKGQVNVQISGFTPMGTFSWKEWYPNGKQVSFRQWFTNNRTLAVTPQSGIVRLDEDCSTDVVGGRYKLSATDNTTPHRLPIVIYFLVGAPRNQSKTTYS